MSIRHLEGFGGVNPLDSWPNNSKIAINFVINYEEGAELSPLNGDPIAEFYGGEFPLVKPNTGQRHLGMESLFEYGSRAGIWRLIRLFDQEHIPVTFFITGFALASNQALCQYLKNCSHEIAGHGWRWIDYKDIDIKVEKKHIQQTTQTIKDLTGHQIAGWYTGRRSAHTRDLLIKIGGFLYDSDSYADDYPYFIKNHLIIPYSLDCNDFRYSTSPGFNYPDQFFHHLKDTFDYLYQENRKCMMSIGLHPRFSGHPGRCLAIEKFIQYIKQFDDIWITRRIDIAKYWIDKTSKN